MTETRMKIGESFPTGDDDPAQAATLCVPGSKVRSARATGAALTALPPGSVRAVIVSRMSRVCFVYCDV